MGSRGKFSEKLLQSVIGGVSSLDLPKLDISNFFEATSFLKSYGYDLNNEEDEKELWSIHRRAISIIRDQLLREDEALPELLTDPHKLGNPANLILYAGTMDKKENIIQKWSCGILKVMHIISHLEHDLFNLFTGEIREKVLRPLRAHIVDDSVSGVVLGLKSSSDQIKLKKFEVKPSKSISSAVIKLLAKKEYTTLDILDHIGIRFVTRSILDCFRVVRLLLEEHIVTFPNIVADQSRNSLYPVAEFMDVINKLPDSGIDNAQVENLLDERFKMLLALDSESGLNNNKEFSGESFRYMKFVARNLIEIEAMNKNLHFFFPFEIQIVDYKTYLNNISGPEAHTLYKERQKVAARVRAFPFLES